jgi:hypothetical protein
MDEQCTADGESISIRVHGVAAGEESLLSGTADVYLSEDLLLDDVRIDVGLGLRNLSALARSSRPAPTRILHSWIILGHRNLAAAVRDRVMSHLCNAAPRRIIR